MEKHIKDLKKIKVERDSLQATLTQTDVSYQKFKLEKDSLSVEHNKLQKYYKNMEQTLLKQQKELKKRLVMYANPKMKYISNLSRDKYKWTETYRGRWLLMKGYNKFWNRPRESNLSTMIMSSKITMNSRNNIVCLR